MIFYVVIGVRHDGSRRLLSNGLTFRKAQEVAGVLRETQVFREMIVELERVGEPVGAVDRDGE